MGKKNKANDKYRGFKDELTLAELIQNAAMRGLKSTKSALFRNANGEPLHSPVGSEESIVKAGGALLDEAPEGTASVCAIGAMSLSPPLTHPLSVAAANANDRFDDDDIPRPDSAKGTKLYYTDKRSLRVGAAFEQALRPD